MASRIFEVNIDLNKYQLLNAVIQVLASAPSSPSAGQVYYSSADTTFYGYNGTTWINLGSQGSGSTNLTFSRDGTTVTVESSTGSDAILPIATTSLAGVMSAADKNKLDGVATGATANDTDANLKARANHTGTQLASTISDFDTAVSANSAVTANTAKVSNATHTGEVTGSTALTIANDAVTNAKLANVATATIKGRVTASSGDPEDLTAAQVRTLLNVADGATANAGTVTSVNLTNGTGISVSGGPITAAGSITVTNTAPHIATNIAEGTRTTTTVPITSSTGTGATLSAASTSLAGVMSSADKTKLDGVEAGATADQNAAEVPFDNTATGFAATNVQTAINEAKTYADGLVTGALVNKGGYNAATNTPDLDTTPIAGIKNGWTYVITAAGTFFSEAVQIGDMIIANQNTPTTAAHWTIVNKNIPDIVNASETEAGLVEEGTDAELTAGTATGATGAKLFVSPAKLRTYLNTATSGLTNAVKYTTTIGNGSATTITVTHNIGKQFNTVQVFTTGSPFAQIECEVQSTSTTQTTFVFNTAPTTNQYTAVIVG